MQPLDPPPTSISRWSVSGDTLAISSPQVTFYYSGGQLGTRTPSKTRTIPTTWDPHRENAL